jgi:hypothetical protein
MLNSAWQALRAGSLLVFDISTIMNSQTYFADTTQYTTLRDGYMVHRARVQTSCQPPDFAPYLFRKHNDVFHRLEECHTQRVYRLDEVLRLIADTPFDLQGIFSPETRNNLLSRRNSDLDHHYPRLFFVVEKVSMNQLYRHDLAALKVHPSIIGIDEAGRGALAGPVVVVAVSLDYSYIIPNLNDSKKLSPSIRERYPPFL